MQFYSEITKKLYDSAEECQKAEETLVNAQKEKTERRKNKAKLVDEKRKAYEAARKEYHQVLDDFCKEFGSYHFTYNSKDESDVATLLDEFFFF